jgi:hypothetical protein
MSATAEATKPSADAGADGFSAPQEVEKPAAAKQAEPKKKLGFLASLQATANEASAVVGAQMRKLDNATGFSDKVRPALVA